jgi:chitinase
LAPSGTQQFTATVLGTSNAAVTWSINPSVGTISAAGLYTAPSSILTAQTVIVTAQSAADPTKSASGVVSLQTPPVVNQWSMGYYLPYAAGWGYPAFPVSSLQWNGLTHVIHTAVLVNADGTLNPVYISDNAATLITAAHANQVKVLVGLQGDFGQAIANQLSTFVANIMTVVNTYGYDGVDIDWELDYPGFAGDPTSAANMTTFAHALRTALGNRILTAAALDYEGSYWGSANAYASFDRINVMTYAMDGPAQGWDLWYLSPLFSVPPGFPNGGVGNWYLHFSLDYTKAQFLAAGVPAAKLGLGLAFYGGEWNGGVLASDPTQGISGPLQVWQAGQAPTGTSLNYNAIVPLITEQNYHWDPLAVVPYLSNPGTPSTSWYLTYDNPQSIQAKVQYIIAQNLGGWIIWHLGADYVAGNSHPHPLLDAVQAGRSPSSR